MIFRSLLKLKLSDIDLCLIQSAIERIVFDNESILEHNPEDENANVICASYYPILNKIDDILKNNK